MRVELVSEGGVSYFPGLSRPVVVDSAQLDPSKAAELERLVQAAHFFDLPAHADAPPPGAADYRHYTVTVEDGGRRHSVKFTDLAKNPQLAALRDFVRATFRAKP